MKIPQNVIDQVRVSANIVDVISESVQLRKRGANYVGLCPFHNEKTPSFVVSEDKQIFNCFGCHKGGNVFSFLMEYKKISFVESVQELAEKLGIQLSYSNEDLSLQNELEIFYDINVETAKFYSNVLLNNEEAIDARNYLDRRGISLKTIREFGIGYSPNRDAVVNHLVNKKVNIEKAVELGIVGKYHDSRLYDRYAGRIIFPIFSTNGRVIGFGGRTMEANSSGAKYINSPESPIYSKGKVFYGLSFTKDSIRTKNNVLLIEGYFDLIALYQAGIKNTVAVSGTALTPDQAQLLSRFTKNATLLFDDDEAGVKASLRSIEILLKHDFDIRIASLEPGEDPDSFVRKRGAEKFNEKVDKAGNFLEFQTDFFVKRGDFDDPLKTAAAIRELVKPLVFLNDMLKRSLLLKDIAKKFNLREMLLEDELNRQLKTTDKETAKSERRILKQPVQKITKSIKIEKVVLKRESELLKLLFEGREEILDPIFKNIPADFIIDEKNRKFFNIIKDAYQESGNAEPSFLLERITDEEDKGYISGICLEKYFTSKNWDDVQSSSNDQILLKFTDDLIRKIKSSAIDIKISEIQNELQEDPENEFHLMERLKSLLDQKRKINKEIKFT